ncbi:hypothetical protein GWI33_022695 [Rhynchophorus ferrugineus]|uniref:MULE transposase domain-containing protein n=1 Tax=Rhynchophorus ferrugineus TaxID=354439 RepID=A0A834IUE4_RHYFE|nr:hypothetical protein GWI33_022695 [Rhynchophorus ferrugineus]
MHNINHQRGPNDVTATNLKVEKWNREGRNHAFLLKRMGEDYEGLEFEDFVLGYMNDIMENILKQTTSVICIDGTHGTNKMKYELVTVLTQDENKMGFSVAFRLSNRRDQIIIKFFLKTLVLKLGRPISCQYIMRDDETRFYNAWIKIMNAAEKPGRLLCS